MFYGFHIIACLIRLCPEEFSVNAIISLEDDLTSTIRPCMLGKTKAIGPSSLALWLHRLSKECFIIVWLGPLLPERVGIAYLVCFALFFFIFLVYFPPAPPPPKKNFPFIIIRHEFFFPLIYNPLMKLSSLLFKKFLYLFLYLLSYEYVCKLSYVSLYMFHSMGFIPIPKRVHHLVTITRILMI